MEINHLIHSDLLLAHIPFNHRPTHLLAASLDSILRSHRTCRSRSKSQVTWKLTFKYVNCIAIKLVRLFVRQCELQFVFSFYDGCYYFSIPVVIVAVNNKNTLSTVHMHRLVNTPHTNSWSLNKLLATKHLIITSETGSFLQFGNK